MTFEFIGNLLAITAAPLFLATMPANAPTGEAGTCSDDDCVPWESPNGGSKEFEFHRPTLPTNTIPSSEWVDAKDKEGNVKPGGISQAREYDPGQGPWLGQPDEHVPKESQTTDGSSITVVIENHLGKGLTTSEGEVLDPNECIELYAQWFYRYKIRVSKYTKNDEGEVNGSTSVEKWTYAWKTTCTAKICETC